MTGHGDEKQDMQTEWGIGSAYKILCGKHEDDPTRTWEDNIKTDFKDTGYGEICITRSFVICTLC
jgi:hypothetical protein